MYSFDFSPGRMQTLTSFPVAQFPWELCPRGISWKTKGRKTGQLHDGYQDLSIGLWALQGWGASGKKGPFL